MHYFCQVNRSKQRKINVKTPPTIVIGIVLLLLTFRQESRAILVQNTPLFKDTLVKINPTKNKPYKNKPY